MNTVTLSPFSMKRTQLQISPQRYLPWLQYCILSLDWWLVWFWKIAECELTLDHLIIQCVLSLKSKENKGKSIKNTTKKTLNKVYHVEEPECSELSKYRIQVEEILYVRFYTWFSQLSQLPLHEYYGHKHHKSQKRSLLPKRCDL